MTCGRFIACLTGCVMVLCCCATAAEIITLQNGPGYTGTTDAWLNEGSRRNYGGSEELRVRWDDGYSDDTVIKFDLTGQIPSGQRILSASLSLWYIQDHSMTSDNAITIKPYRLQSGAWWDENIHNGEFGYGVNWEYRDINEQHPWAGEAGGWYDKIEDHNGVARIKRPNGSAQNAIEPQHWVSFNVAPSVTQWYGGAQNNGFLLVAVDFEGGGNDAYGTFGSRNGSLSEYRPKLAITYEGALLPHADANGPYEVGPGGEVIFDGSGSYDPDGGNITQWLWDIDNDGIYGDVSGQTVVVGYDYLNGLLGLGDHTIGLKVYDDENDWAIDTSTLSIIPEPASLTLLVIGVSAILVGPRRRRQT